MSDTVIRSNSKADEEDSQFEKLIKNSRILMIDDEPINMEVLQIHLQAEGYKNFLSTSDSANAFQMVRDIKPDIIMLDLMMPEVDGFTILQMIRSDPDIMQTPVIVLTSSNDAETKLRALRLGANDFLAKPVDSSELALRLRNTLAAQAYHLQMSYFDSLTGLPNRKFLNTLINKATTALAVKNQMAALLLIDLSRFKNINDSLGREAGDKLLQSYSKRIVSAFAAEERPSLQLESALYSNFAFRLSGVKFVVFLPSLKRAEDCLDMVRVFLQSMNQPLALNNENYYLSSCVGIAMFPYDGTGEQALLTHAETAMRQARKRSDNTYAFYAQDMDEKAQELLEIENGLKQALDNGEFFLVYQPKISVRTKRIIGAEALIRWKHPRYGLISPDHFISLAEDNGQIISIGNWVLDTACLQAALWRQQYGFDFKIAVNVSMKQLNEADFVATVSKTLATHNLTPSALTIELTENMIMENAEDNVAKLEALKFLGISMSIDDFGTGYSSLSYLERFPLDELKVDQSFLRKIKSPLDKVPIVKAICKLAHELNLSIVAEGIETHHQLAHIAALKVQTYQGYFCSGPVMVPEFEELLVRYNGDQSKAA